jgi:hypothetical protein
VAVEGGSPALAGAAADSADDAAAFTVFTAVLTVEPSADWTVDWPDPSGGAARVSARAWRENTSMKMKIPAATIASCTALTAMRRAIGCDICSSYRRIPDLATLSQGLKPGHAVRSPPYSAVGWADKGSPTQFRGNCRRMRLFVDN